MKAIRIPIEDTLDLHAFQPRDIPSLLDEYLRACCARKISSVRIITGKGTGTLRKRVESLMAGDPRVKSLRPAPPEAGGWGALLVDLDCGE